jgi:sulfur-carrier protein
MLVTIKLYFPFREGRPPVQSREYAEGTKVVEVIEDLELPKEQVATVLVNGQRADLEMALNNHDVMAVLPYLGGG